MMHALTLHDVQFRYWLDEYDTLAMDGDLDANHWCDDYHGADTGLALTPTLSELREAFASGYTPHEAVEHFGALVSGWARSRAELVTTAAPLVAA